MYRENLHATFELVLSEEVSIVFTEVSTVLIHELQDGETPDTRELYAYTVDRGIERDLTEREEQLKQRFIETNVYADIVYNALLDRVGSIERQIDFPKLGLGVLLASG